MKKILFFLSFIVFLMTSKVYAALSINAEIDKTQINSDETITYKLTIISDEKVVPPLKLPDFSNFVIISHNQSSDISVSRGKINTKIVYIYILAPKVVGKIIIEPASIKTKYHTYYTKSFEIEVNESRSFSLPESLPPSEKEKQIPQEDTSLNQTFRITL